MNFYVRNFTQEFPLKVTNTIQDSVDGFLHYYDESIWLDKYMIGYLDYTNIYFGFLMVPNRTPVNTLTSLGFSGPYRPYDSHICLNYDSWQGANVTDIDIHRSDNWVAKGWSSDPTTLKTQIGTYLKQYNDVNLVEGYVKRWEDLINLLFFTITFTDSPGEVFYLFCAYEGNTSLADEVIEI